MHTHHNTACFAVSQWLSIVMLLANVQLSAVSDEIPVNGSVSVFRYNCLQHVTHSWIAVKRNTATGWVQTDWGLSAVPVVVDS